MQTQAHNNETSRDKTIDIFRGIAIFLILFSHVYWPNWVKYFVSSFHLALFLFITGFFIEISASKYGLKDFLVGKYNKILKPYLLALLIFLTKSLLDTRVDWPIEEHFGRFWDVLSKSTTSAMTNSGYSIYLWFLPPFFFSSLLLFIIFKYFKKHIRIIFILLLIISILIFNASNAGMYITTEVVWGLDKVPLFVALGIIGNQLFKYVGIAKKYKKRLMIASFVTLCTAPLWTVMVDYRKMTGPSAVLIYIYAIIGCIFVYLLSDSIYKINPTDKFRSLVIFLGENSLGIYITQAFVYFYVNFAMNFPDPKIVNFYYNIIAISMTIVTFSVIKYIDSIIFRKKQYSASTK